MTLLRYLIVPVALLSLETSRAEADIVFNFGQNGNVSETTDFTVIAGGQIILDIYATQEGQVEGPPTFFFSDVRLSQVGDGNGAYLFDLSIDAAGSPGMVQTQVVPDEDFSFGDGYVDDTSTGLQAPNILRAGAFATLDNPIQPDSVITPVKASNPQGPQFMTDTGGTLAENSILLGSVTIDVAADAIGSFDLAISSLPNQFLLGDNVQGGPFIDLPVLNGTLSVSAVPEPSTWAMCSLGLGFVVLRRRKNSKAKAVKA